MTSVLSITAKYKSGDDITLNGVEKIAYIPSGTLDVASATKKSRSAEMNSSHTISRSNGRSGCICLME